MSEKPKSFSDQINEKMTVPELMKVFIEALDIVDNKLDNMVETNRVLADEVGRLAKSFRPIEAVASQNESKRSVYGGETTASRGESRKWQHRWHESKDGNGEYCGFDSAPEDVKKLAVEHEVKDGYKYARSKNGIWITKVPV